jgi:uncharacterized protein (TIGR02172 family)
MKDLGKPFAHGRTADVYDWADGEVLKLYRSEYSTDIIEQERAVSEIVNRAGIPSPEVGDIVEVEGRYGIVFERIAGLSMLHAISRSPWLTVRYAKMLAGLQARLHEVGGPKDLPSQRERLARKIRLAGKRLDEATIAKALVILDSLPDGSSLCHGDFHPDNILMTSSGPVIIDCVDVGRGNPVCDVARTSILVNMAAIPEDKSNSRLLSLGRTLSHAAYIKAYSKIRPIDRAELDKWRIVNAAGRLCERIPEEKRLVAFVETRLA